jgi:hypothetical protein
MVAATPGGGGGGGAGSAGNGSNGAGSAHGAGGSPDGGDGSDGHASSGGANGVQPGGGGGSWRLSAEHKSAFIDHVQHYEPPHEATPQVTGIALGPSDVPGREKLCIRFGILEIRTHVPIEALAHMAERIAGPRSKPN